MPDTGKREFIMLITASCLGDERAYLNYPASRILTPASSPAMPDDRYRWYRELNGYQWFVLIVAALGWLLDCFDQQLFILARQSAMATCCPARPTRRRSTSTAATPRRSF